MKRTSIFIAILFIITLFTATVLIYLRISRPQTTAQTKVRAQNPTSQEMVDQELKRDGMQNMNKLSPYQQLKFNEFRSLLPISSGSAEINYSQRLNRVIISVPKLDNVSSINALLVKYNLMDIYQLEGANMIVVRQASSSQQAEMDEIALVLQQIEQRNESQKNIQGVSAVNAQTSQDAQTADPEEPYQPDQTAIVHVAEFVQNLMSFGQPDQELDQSDEGNADDSNHDDSGEQDENGPLVYSPDTSGIPCESGKDLGTKDGYRRGIKVIIKVCDVQGIQVNSQISGEVNKLLNDARSSGFEMAKGSGGFRTMATQIALRKTNGCPSDPTAPSSSCKTPTARPGWSNHQMGLAIDFVCNGSLIKSKTGGCFEWLASNANRFGLQNFPKEAWHWSVDGK